MTDKKTPSVQHRDWGTWRQVRAQLALIVAVAGVWGVLFLILVLGQGCGSQPAVPSAPTQPAVTSVPTQPAVPSVPTQPAVPSAPSAPVTWDNTIGPLLAQHCVVCHGGAGALNLDSYEHALKGGKRGAAIIPGDSANSRLLKALRGSEPGLARMPLNRPALSEEQINVIAAWIDAGAPR